MELRWISIRHQDLPSRVNNATNSGIPTSGNPGRFTMSSSKGCGWARPAPGVACIAASGVALQVRHRTVRLLYGGDQGRSSERVSGRCLAGVVVWLLDKLVTGDEAGEWGGYRKKEPP